MKYVRPVVKRSLPCCGESLFLFLFLTRSCCCFAYPGSELLLLLPQQTRLALERRRRKLRPLGKLIFGLYFSGDRRKRDLFGKRPQNLLEDNSGGGKSSANRANDGYGRDSNRSGYGNSDGRQVDLSKAANSTSAPDGEHTGTGRCRGSGGDGDGDCDGDGEGNGEGEDGEELVQNVFRVMQQLDMVDENSPLRRRVETVEILQDGGSAAPEANSSPAGATTDGPAAGEHKTSVDETKDENNGAETATADREFLNRPSASGTGGDAGSSVMAHQMSVVAGQHSRWRAGGGSSGFYHDAGQLGEDHWQSVSATLPDLAPRLPSSWTSASVRNLCSPQPSSSNLANVPSRKSIASVSGGSTRGAVRPSPRASRRAGMKDDNQAASHQDDGTSGPGTPLRDGGNAGLTHGGTSFIERFRSSRTFRGMSLRNISGTSMRNRLGRNTSNDADDEEARKNRGATAPLRSGNSGRQWSRMFSISLNAWPTRASERRVSECGEAGAEPKDGRSGLALAAFKGVKDPSQVQRLQLSGHKVGYVVAPASLQYCAVYA